MLTRTGLLPFREGKGRRECPSGTAPFEDREREALSWLSLARIILGVADAKIPELPIKFHNVSAPQRATPRPHLPRVVISATVTSEASAN